jgi:hypothetical protein
MGNLFQSLPWFRVELGGTAEITLVRILKAGMVGCMVGAVVAEYSAEIVDLLLRNVQTVVMVRRGLLL